MIISGSFTNALAIATRCFCPPDNFATFILANPDIPSSSNTFATFIFRSALFKFDRLRTKSMLHSTLKYSINW